jgi:hypothetical protein
VADVIPAPVTETPTPPAVGFVDGAGNTSAAPVPPDVTEWWDTEDTVANVLAQLRFEQLDVDVGRITALVPVGGALINQHLDRYEPLPEPTPSPVQSALEQVVIELYRRKDSALVAANSSYTSDMSLLRYGAADVLAEVAPMLTPWRQRWGFA